MAGLQLIKELDGGVRSYNLEYHPSGSKSLEWDDGDNWWVREGWLPRFAEYESHGEGWYGYQRLRNCHMFLTGKFDMGPVYVRHISVYSDKYSTSVIAFLTVASPETLNVLEACEGIRPGRGRSTYIAHRDGIERLEVCKSVEFDADGKPYALGVFIYGLTTDAPDIGWIDSYTCRPPRLPSNLKKFDGMSELLAPEKPPF